MRMRAITEPDPAPAAGAVRRTGRSRLRRIADFADRNVFIVLVFAAAGLLRVGLLGLGIGSDTWYTLLGGRVVSRSWIPHDDTLTVLGRGHEWVDQQWLAHLFLYGSWVAGGWPLALLILLLGYLGAFAIAAATARRAGVSATSTAVVGLICIVVALGESAFRAQTLAYPLFAALFLLLLRDELHPSRRVLLALPILVLWANVHGSVVLGAGLVCLRGLTLAWTRRAVEPRAVVLIAVPWLCTIASPYGFALPGYYLRLLHNPALSDFVSEWQPATVKNQPLFFVLLLLGVLLLARGSQTLFTQLALLLTAVGALLAVRSVVWFALTAAAVLPAALDSVLPTTEAPRRRRLNVTVAGLSLCALLAAGAAYADHPRTWFEGGYPRAAAARLGAAAGAEPNASIFATERYADWLLFLQPQLAGRIAYDVRFELLGQRRLTEIARFRLEQGPSWMRVADGYRLFVLDPVDDRGAVDLLKRQGSRVLFRNRDVVVLDRGRGR